ncbi:MAG TPA: AAA family ATPase [Gemmatimonadaceae bacterium]|nr:AAA family ATPase [Gemmatimonadaceae bacterium]
MSRAETEHAVPSPGIALDPDIRSPLAGRFEEALRDRVVGQDQAVRAVSSLYEIALARLNAPSRPIGTLLLLGPTGCGKTRVAETAAEILFGSAGALIRIDCAEYQHPHEIAKLIGSPPGYVGHGETSPLLTQEALDRQDRSGVKLALVLFDEIEKAAPVLWQLLLGVLDRGTLTLGDNRRVDFTRTIVMMSSNLGAVDMAAVLSGGVGFGASAPADGDHVQDQLQRAAIEAARRHFSPEFMNRIDKTVVFRPLSHEHLCEVLDLELGDVQRRILLEGGTPFVLSCTDAARERLLHEGTDRRYGARHLRRAIDRLVVAPLARLVTSGQVGAHDRIEVALDSESGEFVFRKRSGPAAVHVSTPVTEPGPHATGDQRDVALLVMATTVAVTAAVGVATGLTARSLATRRRS